MRMSSVEIGNSEGLASGSFRHSTLVDNALARREIMQCASRTSLILNSKSKNQSQNQGIFMQCGHISDALVLSKRLPADKDQAHAPDDSAVRLDTELFPATTTAPPLDADDTQLGQ